ITFAVHAAASLMQLLKMQRDAVGLSIFSDTLETNTPARSSTMHQKLLLMKLEEAMSQPEDVSRGTAAADALHRIAESIHRRSLVVIFSDMMEGGPSDDLFSGLQHLKYNKHEVVLFHVVDKKLELDFDFQNRPYRFVDVETGETVKVHANSVREYYLEKIKEYRNKLMLKCAQYRIDFVEADIHEGFNQVLQSYLIKRQKMV
ncbi:MAG: VWA domain-containing protein, partial [Bacteroidota bacterium]